MSDYSEKEKWLIGQFGFENMMEHVVPPKLYDMIVQKVFVENITGDHVESLRRCYGAFYRGEVYRGTKEWDNMIEVKE